MADKQRTIAQLAEEIRDLEAKLGELYQERTQRAGEEDAKIRQRLARERAK